MGGLLGAQSRGNGVQGGGRDRGVVGRVGKGAAGRPLEKEPHRMAIVSYDFIAENKRIFLSLLGRQSRVRSRRAGIKAGCTARRAGVSLEAPSTPAASEKPELGRAGGREPLQAVGAGGAAVFLRLLLPLGRHQGRTDRFLVCSVAISQVHELRGRSHWSYWESSWAAERTFPPSLPGLGKAWEDGKGRGKDVALLGDF